MHLATSGINSGLGREGGGSSTAAAPLLNIPRLFLLSILLCYSCAVSGLQEKRARWRFNHSVGLAFYFFFVVCIHRSKSNESRQ